MQKKRLNVYHDRLRRISCKNCVLRRITEVNGKNTALLVPLARLEDIEVDIKRLMNKAYRTAPTELWEKMEKRNFIGGLIMDYTVKNALLLTKWLTTKKR